MSALARYTYAVAQAVPTGALADLRGMDSSRVDLVRHRDIVAVTSVVPRAAWTEATLRARLNNLDELETMARTHHAVVEAVAIHATTLPLRLGTIHNGVSGVLAMLERRYDELCANLDRLRGRVEIGVKVSAILAEQPTAEPLTGASTRTGRDYLNERRRQRRQGDEAWRVATAAARRLDLALAELAVERREHRPRSDGGNLLNTAYLVDAGRAADLTEHARRVGADLAGVQVEVTGPWAPYSFAAPPEFAAPPDGAAP